MKRFWTSAAVSPTEGGWGVALDGKPVRTPARVPLLLPTAPLAEAVADEWNAQGEEVRPLAMPLTGLANAAIDRIAPDPGSFAAALAAYAATDTLLYRTAEPPDLVARQAALWDPLLAWATARYDVAFHPTTAILHVPQPPATLARLGAAFAAQEPFRLAALHPVVTVCGSAIVALAVLEGRLDADGAWTAGQLDELWQAERWGSDPWAETARADKRAALDAGCRLLGLL